MKTIKLLFFLILICNFSNKAYPHVISHEKWTNNKFGTHQWITENAITNISPDLKETDIFQILINNKRSILNSSNRPDLTQNDFGTFQGHFYNPITEMNWMNNKSPTALTRFIKYTNKALKSKRISSLLENLGYAIHYLEDSCVPHHAKNLTAGLSWHSSFEKYADKIKDSYKIDHTISLNENLSSSFSQDITNILRECSLKAYDLAIMADSSIEYSSKEKMIHVSLPCYKGVIYNNKIPDCESWKIAAKESLHNAQIAVGKYISRMIIKLNTY